MRKFAARVRMGRVRMGRVRMGRVRMGSGGRVGWREKSGRATMLAVRHFWSRGAIPGVAVMLILGVGLGVAWPSATAPDARRVPVHVRHVHTPVHTPADRTRTPAWLILAARHDPADTRACGALPQFPDGTAAQIMAGRLTIAPFKQVVIDPKRNGDIDWAMDPYDDPTWVLDFQTGTWIEALVEAYLTGGPHAAAYRERAKEILTGWMADVPLASQNPETLMCSAEAFPGQAWIHNQIPVALDYYAAHWQGAYNHGLSQDLELLRAGCAYPASEWGGQPLYWRQLARQQMIESFQPNQYGPAVDAQGATNEQSTGYENFNFGLWTEAEGDLAACHQAPLPATDSARIASMAMFLALATQPDGRLVQIGDTYAIGPRDRAGTPLEFAATRGAAGKAPAQRVGVYEAGYVFGRSGWGTPASSGTMSFYSLRFGPGTQIHGHADHMGLTYYARGRDLIVDSGHDGYANSAYRAYLLSPEAASTLVMPDVLFDASAATSLVAKDIGATAQFYEFTDTAFGGLIRDRSVYVSQAPDFVVVFDRASGGGVYQQLWHLDPGLTVRTVGAGYAVATAPGTELVIRQVALPGQVIPAGSTQVTRGQVDPYQGWVSRGQNQRTPAPVVSMTRYGSSASILTVIVPAAPGAAVSASAVPHGTGWYLLRLAIGQTSRTLLVSADGTITG
jgi:Heparinase II/III-like protein